MIGFLARRIALAIPILVGISVVVFTTIKIIPGDPLTLLLGPTASAETREALTTRLGLDQPWPIQYLTWMTHVLTGDFGVSIAKQTPVLPLVWTAFGNTLILTAFAAAVAFPLGIALGTISALRRGKPSATVSNSIALFSISVPQYSIGLLLIIFIASGTGALPTGGMYGPTADWADLVRHLILPGITAALVPAGVLARMFRSVVIDVMSMDFIDALRARGLSERRILLHAFHNTLPTLLTIGGLQLGYLLSGVVFVEAIFNWPGIGLFVFQSISQRDQPVIQAGVLISALAFVLINLVVDALRAVVDPRLRA